MSYVNIGANSGSNINEFLYMYNQTWNVTASMWHHVTNSGCGVCKACEANLRKSTVGELATAADGPLLSIHAIGVEMMMGTFKRLQKAFRVFGVPGVALHAAGGNELKTV